MGTQTKDWQPAQIQFAVLHLTVDIEEPCFHAHSAPQSFHSTEPQFRVQRGFLLWATAEEEKVQLATYYSSDVWYVKCNWSTILSPPQFHAQILHDGKSIRLLDHGMRIVRPLASSHLSTIVRWKAVLPLKFIYLLFLWGIKIVTGGGDVL